MNSLPAALRIAFLGFLALRIVIQTSQAASLTIANASFEAPAFDDGGYDYLISPGGQGNYGWYISDGAFVYNPTALDYATAGANGTAPGAVGSQVSGIFQFGDYTIYQPLAGADGVAGNEDDPVLMPQTDYALTVAVGQRLAGNQFGVTYGGYDIQLRAGPAFAGTIIGRETDAVTPPPGTFVDRTIVVDSSTVDPNLYGQPLAILLRKTIVSQTANTDFDNVRLEVVRLLGDYNNDNSVDAADYTVWRDNLDAAIALPNEGITPGMVTQEDYDLWKARLGAVAGAGSGKFAPVDVVVPEPTGLVVLVTALSPFFGSNRSALRRVTILPRSRP
jgi:hypothetical protein